LSNLVDVDVIDVLQIMLRGERSDIHTALPGKVVTYYPSKQTADIQLLVKKPQFDLDGKRVDSVEYPLLPNVPVMWPRAGGYMITMPLAADDFVWVSWAEAAIGEVLMTGQVSDPIETSRHTITHPVCTPGCTPDPAALTDSSVTVNDRLVMGKSGGPQIQVTGSNVVLGNGATDSVALARVVDSNFSAIVSYLEGIFTTAGAAPSTIICAGSGSPATIASALPLPSTPTTASALVKSL
jgi:Phage protein Gp138 N-terminal domain